MLKKIDYVIGRLSAKPAFVIGTGRSGTHWLGYSLGNHPEVRATIEVEPMFTTSTRMALDPSLEPKLGARLIRAYRRQLFYSVPKVYVDKTHPNIWHAEKLLAAFPNALFLGIERDVFATVASMMRHKGVSAWHKRWKEFPVPNRFLGISEELAKSYDALPLPAKCARRWVVHKRRMAELRGYLGDSLMVISYEDFAKDTGNTVLELQRFLGLKQPIPIPEVKIASLEQWKQQLSANDIADIQHIVNAAAAAGEIPI